MLSVWGCSALGVKDPSSRSLGVDELEALE